MQEEDLYLVISGRVKTGWSVKQGKKTKKGQVKILNRVNRQTVVTGRSELRFWNSLESLAMTQDNLAEDKWK